MATIQFRSTGSWKAKSRKVVASKTAQGRRSSADGLPTLFNDEAFVADDRLDVHAVYDLEATPARSTSTSRSNTRSATSSSRGTPPER